MRSAPDVASDSRPRAAVLGSPITQSLSPVLHRTAYHVLGLDWEYDAIDVDERALPAFFDQLDETWRGLSLTMPLKRAVVPLLDELSPLAERTEAVNTVVIEPGRRYGDNTDVHGIIAALEDAGVRTPARATVLGGGATATSAVAALCSLGLPRVTVVVRSRDRARSLLTCAERLGVSVDLADWPGPDHAWRTDLLISTVPAGVADAQADRTRGGPAALLDVVYRPWPTVLGRAAAAAGSTVVGGLAMLVHQAARQVELMTGLEAPVAAMNQAGEEALNAGQ